MHREWKSSVKSKTAVMNLRLNQYSPSLSPFLLSLCFRTPLAGFLQPNCVVMVVWNGFSRQVICIDRSRLSPTSPRLAVCSPVQSCHPVGLDWTEPYLGLGSSGLVESLEVSRTGVMEEVYNKSGAAVVKAKQRIQLQTTRPPASLHIPREALYLFWLYTQWNGFRPGMGESRWSGGTSVYESFTVLVLVFCFSWLF